MNNNTIFLIADQLTYARTKGEPFDSFKHVKIRTELIEQMTASESSSP